MAKLTLDIPDAAVPRIGAAFRAVHPELEGTDAQIVKQALSDQIRHTTKEYERQGIGADYSAQVGAAFEANDADVDGIPIA